MAFVPLTLAETDAKSPIDDALWAKVKADLDDLDARIAATSSSPLMFPVVGRLSLLNAYPYKRSFAHAIVNQAFTPTLCRWVLKQSGTSGTIGFDIRKHTTPKTPITGIDHVYSGTTSAIARRSAAVNTQSITRATPQILTQSITFAKAAANVQSVINISGTTWQYNLNTALDSDSVVGDSILLAGCTAGGNNGTFVITEIGRGGGANFTVTNAGGVAQTGVAGTAQPKIMSYNFTNPANANFAIGEVATFAAHTSALNDGNFTILKINQSGNNIWAKNPSGIAQAGVAGTTDTNRMSFNFTLASDANDYVAGEYATTASHSTGSNNGTFVIIAVNSGGNNLIIYVSAGGAVQGGAAGNVSTNRWKYTLSVDPTGSVAVNDNIYCASHTTAANNGTFAVKELNAGGGTNLVIANSAGVAQGGAAGSVYSTKKLVKFASDQSAVYTTASYIEIFGGSQDDYNLDEAQAPFRVVQINRGGGANYNIVIELSSANSQASPAGYVQSEAKSIFTVAPSIAAVYTGNLGDQNVVGSSAVAAVAIAANTPLMLYLTNYAMGGDPFDLTVEVV